MYKYKINFDTKYSNNNIFYINHFCRKVSKHKSIYIIAAERSGADSGRFSRYLILVENFHIDTIFKTFGMVSKFLN